MLREIVKTWIILNSRDEDKLAKFWWPLSLEIILEFYGTIIKTSEIIHHTGL